MSARLISAVCVALLRGAVLRTPDFRVGPYRGGTDPPGAQRFACLDEEGAPAVWSEVYRAPFLWPGGRVDSEERTAPDWTAYGAASAFVALAGAEAVEEALYEAEEGATAILPVAPLIGGLPTAITG